VRLTLSFFVFRGDDFPAILVVIAVAVAVAVLLSVCNVAFGVGVNRYLLDRL